MIHTLSIEIVFPLTHLNVVVDEDIVVVVSAVSDVVAAADDSVTMSGTVIVFVEAVVFSLGRESSSIVGVIVASTPVCEVAVWISFKSGIFTSTMVFISTKISSSSLSVLVVSTDGGSFPLPESFVQF